MKSLSWRIVVSLLVLLASIVYVLPSLPGVGGSSLGNLLPDARISLGLDLKGGMHLTLGVEVDKAVSNSLSLTGQELRAQASEKGITVLRSRLTPDNRLEFLLPRAEQRTELQELLSKDFPQLSQPLSAQHSAIMQEPPNGCPFVSRQPPQLSLKPQSPQSNPHNVFNDVFLPTFLLRTTNHLKVLHINTVRNIGPLQSW